MEEHLQEENATLKQGKDLYGVSTETDLLNELLYNTEATHIQQTPTPGEPLQPIRENKIVFHGMGGDLFGIFIVNLILNIITLGFYRPWARVKTLRFLWSQTEFAGSRFQFMGTGKEMFTGYIKGLFFLLAIFGYTWVMRYFANDTQIKLFAVLSFIGFYVGFGFLAPVAIYGMLRYRLSRTTWRGIHGGFRGDVLELIGNYIGSYFFIVLTLGIYYPWYVNNLREGTINYIRLGNVRLEYQGSGKEMLMIYLGYIRNIIVAMLIFIFIESILIGMLSALIDGFQKSFQEYATLFALSQYSIFFLAYSIANILRNRRTTNYLVNHMAIVQGNETYPLALNMPRKQYFWLEFVNGLMIIFSLGIATPWATVRSIRFITRHLQIPSEFDPDSIAQTEDEFKDATGDDLTGLLDLNWT